MKAQVLYDMREVTSMCSGTDLHQFFYDQTGDPSPSGYKSISDEAATEFIRQFFPEFEWGPVIVTRHSGAVEWLRRRGITGEVISHVSDPAQVADRTVYGVLPLHLAALADEVVSVDLPNLRPDQRGKDLTPEEMDEAGANLRRYRVFEKK